MMRLSHERNQGRASKLGPFAWVRKFGVFRGQTHSADKRRTRELAAAAAAAASRQPDHDQRRASSHAPSQTHQARPASGPSAPPQLRLRHLSHPGPATAESKPDTPSIMTPIDTTPFDGRISRSGTLGTGLGTVSVTEANSVFSLPNRSNQSLATTLTTIRSTATSGVLAPGPGQVDGPARPAHPPVRTLHPHTYTSVTANNMLTDNASMLTLASSRRLRRNSLDTNASVRALPPSSIFNTSRDSLALWHSEPAVDGASGSVAGPSTYHRRFPSVQNSLVSPDRASLASAPLVDGVGGPVGAD